MDLSTVIFDTSTVAEIGVLVITALAVIWGIKRAIGVVGK